MKAKTDAEIIRAIIDWFDIYAGQIPAWNVQPDLRRIADRLKKMDQVEVVHHRSDFNRGIGICGASGDGVACIAYWPSVSCPACLALRPKARTSGRAVAP